MFQVADFEQSKVALTRHYKKIKLHINITTHIYSTSQ